MFLRRCHAERDVRQRKMAAVLRGRHGQDLQQYSNFNLKERSTFWGLVFIDLLALLITLTAPLPEHFAGSFRS
jgi:hypothetical protein